MEIWRMLKQLKSWTSAEGRLFLWMPHWTPGQPNHFIILYLNLLISVKGMMRLITALQSILKCKEKYIDIKKEAKFITKIACISFFSNNFLLRSSTSEFPSNNYLKKKKVFLHLSSEIFTGEHCTATAPPPFHEFPVTLPWSALKEEKPNFHSNI